METILELSKFNHVKYYDGPHKYFIGDQQLTSATKFIGKFKPKFETDKIASRYAKKNGLDGVVCSPKEIKDIRKATGKNFIIVTPGIRLKSKIKNDDQKRVETPKKAIEMGANYLVIGRPITKSKNPLKTLKEINDMLS